MQPIALLSAVLILRKYATDDDVCKYFIASFNHSWNFRLCRSRIS